MTKIAKTADEIAKLVRERMPRANIVSLEIRRDDVFGWQPYVVAAPSLVSAYQIQAESISQELRREYELAT